MLEKIKRAKPYELRIWMWGGIILGFGLGMLLSNYKNLLMIPAILLGAIMHGWAMYRIYSRKQNQKNNVPPHTKVCGLIGTCF